MALPLTRPSLRRQDFDRVLDAMIHDKLSGGEINRTLAKELAKDFLVRRSWVLASVFDAIHRVIEGLGLRAGDRVVLSPLAPAYWVPALRGAGLVPLFADVLEDSPVLDPERVRVLVETDRPLALVADGCLGFLPDFERLASLGIPMIEDLSHGVGGLWKGQSVGRHGAAVLIQFAPETLMAGAGGCFVGLRVEPAVDPGEAPSWESLSDLGSALILSQREDSESFAQKKRENFRHLFLRLPKGIRPPKQVGDGDPVMPWFPILVESGAREVLAYARKKAVEADFGFRNHPHLGPDSSSEFCPRARFFAFHTLIFPLYATFSAKDLDLLGKVLSSLP